MALSTQNFSRRIVIAAIAGLLASSSALALALGSLADVQIIDRDTGQRMPLYRSGERYYVAGKPGNRYAVELRNRLGERVMSVMSIDGINAVSGETASWGQTGYVWAAYEASQITGWRKSMAQVAAFQFAALENSYAARTGRPDQVGVIGVALFREKMLPQVSQAPQAEPGLRGRVESSTERGGPVPPSSIVSPIASASPAPAYADEAENKAQRADAAGLSDEAKLAAKSSGRLGTAHGRIEASTISYTDFERRNSVPDEVIAIYYDSAANLIAQGIIPTPIARNVPRPFPGNSGFVPDPPRW